ncbi:hypothetical protein [Salmonella phage SP1]|uniref:Uncharacterized protein n=1 Tax=Salmonella phage SP1 TaxID=2025818 RepID=A0A249Y0B3_9CAUD|nr:hypothetical protein HYP23_gp122 [Salmonella phage SP1]ASZ77669.1 hypothetical protein [Salmonella phage SP1]
MAEFKPFATAVNNNVLAMSATGLFMTNIDKDALWDLYLASFPAGTNPLYRERTEHDCTCCKQFIRNIGGVVTIDSELNVISIWDNIDLGNEYDVVAAALSAYVNNTQSSMFILTILLKSACLTITNLVKMAKSVLTIISIPNYLVAMFCVRTQSLRKKVKSARLLNCLNAVCVKLLWNQLKSFWN